MKRVDKVLAYVIRKSNLGEEVLVFDHVDFPAAGTQVPAGTVVAGESFEAAAIREVFEESGLSLNGAKFIGAFEWFRKDRNEMHLRNIFSFEADSTFPEKWIHEVSGKGEDEKMRFKFFWLSIAEAEGLLAADQGKYLKTAQS